jgi:predicted nucleic acid-binding protein
VRGVLVDAGPLVAWLDRRDRNHTRSVEALRSVLDPLVTVWPVLVEAMYLLETWSEQASLWALVEAGPIRLAPLGDDDVPRLRELMAKYRDLPMGLADAALVHVAERDGYRRILTIDRRDFEIYGLAGRERFTIVSGPGDVAEKKPRRRSSSG